MESRDLAGSVLVLGLVIFMVGALRWRLAYEGPPETALPAIHADRRRRAFIHLWMIAAMLVTPSGLVAFSTVTDTQISRTLAVMATVIYTLGAVLWVAALAFRLSVVPWAAERTVADGSPPQGFVALDAWAGTLFMIHMVASYGSFAVLGVAVLTSNTLPSWLGWLGLAWGSAFALGISAGGRYAFGFYPPFWSHTYTALVGIVLLTA